MTDWTEEAQKDGVVNFYELPHKLDYENIDPLIRDIVKRINESGWVATMESCQGHPEAEKHSPWAGNVRPMLRLVCRKQDRGRMMAALLEAMYFENDGIPTSIGFEVHPHWRNHANWSEVLIYIHACCVYDRNLGLQAYARFAELVNKSDPEITPLHLCQFVV